ncbi:iron complex transport system substrate-binding protein [Mucilaginibacter oryzae]|uniref:Iron complex transport system substrate-binding protein n=1 Tax=Mucilaginibacter oryzae TaxID=468058 RepID=A0A316HDB3_9SPHI|nr:ABC transporter substrate-binding protein [Mucilaginibacter oryzae]PWK79144.1 iron complex transport system substrate-binding protein [Mucilaginibacter oryzae]
MVKGNIKQLLLSFIVVMISYVPQAMAHTSPKIVSVNGTISEILAGIGMESNIIGTDITSNYPASLKSKPKVGHNRNLSSEGILALQPDIVTGLSTELKPELVSQLKSAGIKLVLFTQTYSADGTRKLIKEVASAFGKPSKAELLIKKLDGDLAAAAKINKGSKPKVLFIYARGTGTMMVAGEGTQMQQIIQMAGGANAVTGFSDFKPLTPEALVAANPDVILLFSSGMDSLGGAAGLMNVQGVAQTNAGKNKRFVTMDGELVSSFGPRLGLAVSELAQKIK